MGAYRGVFATMAEARRRRPARRWASITKRARACTTIGWGSSTRVTQGRPFVTLQNTVYSFNTYKVQNQRELLDGLLALGYQVRDSWENADMSCHIPLHRDRTVARYSGFYLTLRDPRRALRGSSG